MDKSLRIGYTPGMPTKTKTKASKPPSKRTLKRAAHLLQAAHDQIEVFGFDINTYGGGDPLPDGQTVPRMCYIGSVRHQAGCDPAPALVRLSDGYANDPTAGDGPELAVALDAMDKVALRRLNKTIQKAVAAEYEDDVTLTGRFVERLGFEIEKRAVQRFPIPTGQGWNAEDYDVLHEKRDRYQKTYALKLLRQALTEIYAD